jgi:hypothetical protein
MLTSFYQAFAPTSFTLLGLWLIVVQTRHAEWRRSTIQRRRTYAITLNFALPGLMGLLSLVDPTSQTVWRVSFATVAIVGAIALSTLGWPGQSRATSSLLVGAACLGAAVLYVLIAIVAINPSLLRDLGINLRGLQAEAILVSLQVFLGVNVAWLLMFDEVTD